LIFSLRPTNKLGVDDDLIMDVFNESWFGPLVVPIKDDIKLLFSDMLPFTKDPITLLLPLKDRLDFVRFNLSETS